MILSLSLFNFTQWKDKCASYSFTTKTLIHSMCQVSLVVKYNILHGLPDVTLQSPQHVIILHGLQEVTSEHQVIMHDPSLTAMVLMI